MTENEYINSFNFSEKEMKDFIRFAESENVKFVAKDYQKSKNYLQNQLKAYIARTIWHKDNTYFRIIASQDNDLQQALKMFDKVGALLKK
jgi:carboxyl-terminal processing protease